MFYSITFKVEPKSQNKNYQQEFFGRRDMQSFAKKERKKKIFFFSMHFTVCIPFSVQPSSMLVDNVTPAHIAKGWRGVSRNPQESVSAGDAVLTKSWNCQCWRTEQKELGVFHNLRMLCTFADYDKSSLHQWSLLLL